MRLSELTALLILERATEDLFAGHATTTHKQLLQSRLVVRSSIPQRVFSRIHECIIPALNRIAAAMIRESGQLSRCATGNSIAELNYPQK